MYRGGKMAEMDIEAKIASIENLPYTEEEKWALTKFFETIRENKISQNNLAKSMDLSGGTITKIMNSEYSATDVAFSKMIAHFKVKDEAKSSYKGVDFAETSISTKIYKVIRNCHKNGTVHVVSGDPGIGKTKTIRQYKKNNPTNTILVKSSPSRKNMTGMLREIGKELGIRKVKSYDILEEMRIRIKDGMIIIIDESQFLQLNAIEELRELVDEYKENGKTLGLLFVGNDVTVSKIKENGEIANQIQSRIRRTTSLKTTDVKKDDIKLVFPFLATEDKKMELELIYRIAQNKIQGIRGAEGLYAEAHEYALENNIDEVDYNLLIQVAKEIELMI